MTSQSIHASLCAVAPFHNTAAVSRADLSQVSGGAALVSAVFWSNVATGNHGKSAANGGLNGKIIELNGGFLIAHCHV
jgi:hypothetical protein